MEDFHTGDFLECIVVAQNGSLTERECISARSTDKAGSGHLRGRVEYKTVIARSAIQSDCGIIKNGCRREGIGTRARGDDVEAASHCGNPLGLVAERDAVGSVG